MAGQVECDHVEAVGKQRREVAPGMQRAAGAVHEQQRRRFARRWGDVQGEIEAAIRAREAA